MSDFCSWWGDLGLGSLWFIVIIVQLLFVGVYAAVYFALFRDNDNVTMWHMAVVYFNTSFWWWAIWICISVGICGWKVSGFSTPESKQNLLLAAIIICLICGITSCCDVCCAKEGGYFRHQKTMDQCIEHMENMKKAAPIHRVSIECYHYEYHHRRGSFDHGHHGHHGHHGSESRTKRVTYREYREFIYDRWIDESDYPNLPDISARHPIVAVDMGKLVAPGDDFTLNEFDNFRRNFVEQNRFRDQFIDEEIDLVIPGFESQISAVSSDKDRVPWWLNSGVFYFLALIFCSCPLRVLFRKSSKNHYFEIRKLYFLEPNSTNLGNMGVNVTYNIIGNQGTINIDNDPNNMNYGQPPPQYQGGPQPGYQQGYPQPGYEQQPPGWQPQPGYQQQPGYQPGYQPPPGYQPQPGYQPVYNPNMPQPY